MQLYSFPDFCLYVRKKGFQYLFIVADWVFDFLKIVVTVHRLLRRWDRHKVDRRTASRRTVTTTTTWRGPRMIPAKKMWRHEMLWCPEIWGQFHQHSTSSFYVYRSQKSKKDSQVVSLFCTFGICAPKSCTKNVDEIDTWCQYHQQFTCSCFCSKVLRAAFKSLQFGFVMSW